MVVTNSTVAEKTVCWCDGRKILNRRCAKERGAPTGFPGWLGGDGTVSDEACIQADSTRLAAVETPTHGGITDSPRDLYSDARSLLPEATSEAGRLKPGT